MKQEPAFIPDILLEESAAVKYIYLCLADKGELSLSSRELGKRLGISQPTILTSLCTLEDTGLLIFKQRPQERMRPIFKVLSPEEFERALEV